MAESCVLNFSVRNKKGEVVESKLFNDLLHYSSNDREFAKEYYYVGSDEGFISMFRDRLKFDENDEVTFESLKDVTKLSIDKDRLIKTLIKDINGGIKEYDEAVTSLQGFNLTNPYRDKYMATIIPTEQGKVLLTVVERNSKEEKELIETISSRSLIDRIKYSVTSVGGDITFIDEDYSKYDTKHANKAASGLYNVIQLSKNLQGKKLDAIAAEEAGHFAVGALGKHPLVTRLLNMITPDVQESLLKEHNSSIVIDDPKREAAGVLVGKYIYEEVDKHSPFANIAERIINTAKRMFYKLKGDTVNVHRLNAERIAKKIANSFMSDSFEGDINTALETKEIKYHTKDSDSVKAFKRVLGKLNILTAEMSSMNRKNFQEFRELEQKVAIGRLYSNPSRHADDASLDGIITAMESLHGYLTNIPEILDGIDPKDSSKVAENAKDLRQIHYIIGHLIEIGEIAKDLYSNLPAVKEPLRDRLMKMQEHINTINNYTLPYVIEKERDMFLTFLTDMYGEDYITRSAKMLYGSYTDENNQRHFGLHKTEEETVETSAYFKRLLNDLDVDSSWQNRWLVSMANSNDVINQMVYLTKATATRNADIQTMDIWDSVRELEAYGKELGIDTNRILERYDNGSLTGNYISELHWGKYEDAFKEFRKKSEEEYFNLKPDRKKDFSIQREKEFDDWFYPKLKDWHSSNSYFDTELNRYVPKKSIYGNIAYNNLTDNEKLYLEKLLELKGNIDDLLLNGDESMPAHTHLYRMPQFRGSNNNRIQNLRASGMSFTKATATALRSSIINAFVSNSNDRDYGSEATFNSMSNSIFTEEQLMEKHKISRVPLYGINKFEDPNELSTDIYAGLLQYGAMASTYNAVGSVIDILEVGKEVLKERSVEGTKEKLRARSRAYSRYIDFMEMNFYNLYNTRRNFGKLVPEKIAQTMNKISSYVLLGGNLHGGIRNAISGFFEISKEAIAGEYFTIAELKNAHKIYIQYLPRMLKGSVNSVKDDKLSLFLKRFDVGNKLTESVMDYSTRKNALVRLNPFGENVLLPYKSGDHYMQAIPFLAHAQHIHFRYKGKIINLFDAYDEVYIDPTNKKAGKTLKLKEGAMYIDPKTGEERLFKDGSEAVNQDNSDDMYATAVMREICNRMHGIYNKMDKPALHKYWWGQLILAMKGYALGYLYRRFASEKFSVILKRDSGGSMNTFGKLLLYTFYNKREFMNCMRLLVLPIGKETENTMVGMGFSREQYRSLRRNWGDGLVIMLLLLLKSLTAEDDDEDDEEVFKGGSFGGGGASSSFKNIEVDDEGNKALGTIHYLTTGALNEQSAFNTPGGMFVEFNQLTNIGKPSAVNTLELFWDLGTLAVTQERYKQGEKEGELKFWHKLSSYIPWYRSYKVFNDPYKATESYEYGRRAK